MELGYPDENVLFLAHTEHGRICPDMQPSDVPSTQPEKKEKKEKKKLTWRQKKILISVMYGNFFLGSCYSLMAPIFPAEAERKNASPSAYGLVFGIYQLAMFAASPVYGKLMPRLTPAYMLKIGMFVSGVCVMLFGLLDYAPPGTIFIVIACLIRFVDALGAAAFLTASYTTLGTELPDAIGKAMSYTETAFASGLACGPVFGGALFSAGGFFVPFVTIGALLFLGTGVNMILFSESRVEICDQKVSTRKLLSNIDFLIDVIAICTCFAALAFNEATLEPHIRQFSLSPFVTGVIFLISGITDALTSPLWGWLADIMPNAQYLTFVGFLLFITCFLIVGPVSILNFPTNLNVVIVSQFLLGLGMASEIVCSFTHGMKHIEAQGFESNVGTYGLISSTLFSAACLGAFVGPSIGGYMIDHIGYIHATETVVIMKCIVALICLTRLLMLFIQKKKKKDSPQMGNKF